MKRFVRQDPTRKDNTGAPAGASAREGRFPDLASAGRDLARRLTAYRGREGALVVGIVRGGVPPALEAARALGLPLDLAVLRMLLAPRGPGHAVCAANVCGPLVLDEELPPLPAVPRSPLEHFMADALEGLALRAATCRGARPAADVSGRTVILVDNGIHTATTMLAVLRAVRKLRPARVVAAAPVASAEGAAAVAPEADELVYLATPHNFGHTGLWYRNFDVPADETIRAFLEQAHATGPG